MFSIKNYFFLLYVISKVVRMKKYLKKKKNLKHKNSCFDLKYIISLKTGRKLRQSLPLDWKNDEARYYFLEETNYNELISKKYKTLCKTLSYVEQFLILASTFIDCISISALTSLVGVLLGICTTTERMKKFKSIIKKKREQKHDK